MTEFLHMTDLLSKLEQLQQHISSYIFSVGMYSYAPDFFFL